MPVIETANKLEERAIRLEKLAADIEKLQNDRDNAKALYDKEIAINILKLRAGVIPTFEGVPIKNLSGNEIPKVAAGMAYDEWIQYASASATYNAHLKKMKALEMSIKAYQSINKYLDLTKFGGEGR